MNLTLFGPDLKNLQNRISCSFVFPDLAQTLAKTPSAVTVNNCLFKVESSICVGSFAVHSVTAGFSSIFTPLESLPKSLSNVSHLYVVFLWLVLINLKAF